MNPDRHVEHGNVGGFRIAFGLREPREVQIPLDAKLGSTNEVKKSNDGQNNETLWCFSGNLLSSVISDQWCAIVFYWESLQYKYKVPR